MFFFSYDYVAFNKRYHVQKYRYKWKGRDHSSVFASVNVITFKLLSIV